MAQINALIPAGVRVPDLANSLSSGIEIGNALLEAPVKRRLMQAQAQYYNSPEARASVYGSTFYKPGEEPGTFDLYAVGKQGQEVLVSRGVLPPPKSVDTGTGTSFVGPGAAPMGGTIPKDLAGAKAQEAEGKELGESVALYRSMTAKLPGLYQTVQKLEDLSDKATYTTAGQVYDFARKELGMEPREGAVARTEYMAIVDNQILPLLRDTFGAQFTQREGETLRATLGNPDVTPQEKQAVLRAFIDQKVRDIQALALQTGRPAVTAPSYNLPQGITFDQLRAWVQEAIAAGVPEERIRQKMIEMGIDPDQ